MTVIDIKKAQFEFENVVSSITKFDEEITICGPSGNCVLLSEEKYNSLKESFSLFAIPGFKKSINEVRDTPTSDFNKTAPFDRNN